MRAFKALRRIGIAACVAVGLLAVMASGATAASSLKVCVQEKEGGSIKLPKAGACKKGYKLTELGQEGPEGKKGEKGAAGAPGEKGTTGATGEKGATGAAGENGATGATGEAGQKGEAGLSELSKSEQEAVKAILPYVKVLEKGVGGKPTVQFSGVNVQVVSGAGLEASLNGEGNLVVGTDENPGAQTGSNNLVVGQGQSFTSYGSILGGSFNAASGPFTLLGGEANAAGGSDASVTGGHGNKAEAGQSSVSGGRGNTASGSFASVQGGENNVAAADYTSVGGGNYNEASGLLAWIGGGNFNHAKGNTSAIFGGHALTNEETWGTAP